VTSATDAWEERGTRVPLEGHDIFVVDLEPTTAPEHEPLLVIHGFPTSSFDFHRVSDGLARDRRVVLFDMVGYGLSSKPDLAYTVGLQAGVVVALTERLGLGRMSLLTHDYGDTVGGELLARQAQRNGAAAMLVEAGYRRIGLDHFAKPDDPMAQARGTPRLRRNFQGYTLDDAAVLIGFGASAISALPQGYAQNVTRTIEYLDAIETATLATARGIARTAQDDLRSRIIERLMCDLTVDVASIADAAGIDGATLDDAWPQLEPLETDGLIRRNGAVVTITEAGWPFLRCVAACFDQYLDPQASRHAAAI
jgi:pimeloyl-ACP methyl ester carboxylesterase